MPRIDLMRSYPKTSRHELLDVREAVSEKDRELARQFGKDYFDGPRCLGMGGYQYDERFFSKVVLDFIEHFGITRSTTVLDVGCGKGFMVHDFLRLANMTEVYGLDISRYCLENAHGLAQGRLVLGTCDFLPFPDKSFDICIAIATIHNLDLVGVTRSLKEIVRVAREGAFVKVNGYKNEDEKERLLKWNLVAKTILPIAEWENLFADVGYKYDYDFFST